MTNAEKKNETIAALLHSGYTQRTKVLFEKGSVRVKLIEDRGIRISIRLANDKELRSALEICEGLEKISKFKIENQN